MNTHNSKEIDAVKAKKRSDNIVLSITLAISLVFIGIAAWQNISVLILLFAGTLFLLFYIRLFQITLLSNSLRIQNGKHKFMKEMVDEVTNELKIPPIDIYITQDPRLNAFALGYGKPYSIVLNSSVVEELSPEETKAILLHEIGHIKYKHTIISSYTGPITLVVPVLGPLIGWIFGFWNRRAELACDRLALAYTKDPQTVMMALIKIHVGSNFGEYMGPEGAIYQDIKSKGFMRSIAQTLSSHPFLVTRVKAVIDYSLENNIPLPEAIMDYTRVEAQSHPR